MKNNLSSIKRAYLAGFLDGDGSIYVRAKPNSDYRYGFQIAPAIILFQSAKDRSKFEEICSLINLGYIRTRKDGIFFCKKLKDAGFMFDKILVDAPCSGEGTVRSSPVTYLMWNPKTIKILSRLQKGLLASAIEILKPGGEAVYSTCTHAPEENEEVVDFVLKKFGKDVSIEKISLPVKCRPGITSWSDNNYDKNIEKSCRIYPQDNNTEGFFIAKLKRKK
mgnify:CR=1 FL=1